MGNLTNWLSSPSGESGWSIEGRDILLLAKLVWESEEVCRGQELFVKLTSGGDTGRFAFGKQTWEKLFDWTSNGRKHSTERLESYGNGSGGRE
ncbi:MAG: hypothetical protein ACTS6G_02825 [Candidatus Hodgkinia cicadicola]